MKIVFFGSSSFAVDSLQALKQKHEILAVFTQPDRPQGRHLHLAKTPVKICAEYSKIDVFQPQNVNDEETINKLKEFKADLFVVVSFGQKLSKQVLEIPKKYCVNVHASLLPKYRGAAPINYAILNGDKTTGVTIMKMNESMDAGDMILSKSIDIQSDDSIILNEKLAKLGAESLIEALDLIEQGKANLTKQDDSKATKALKLKKQDGLIDWQDSAEHLYNKVRGLLPWPCAYTYYKGKFIKILKSSIADCSIQRKDDAKPAEVILICKKEGIVVACGKGELKIIRVQPEGKKPMSAYDFANGHHIKEKDFFDKKL